MSGMTDVKSKASYSRRFDGHNLSTAQLSQPYLKSMFILPTAINIFQQGYKESLSLEIK